VLDRPTRCDRVHLLQFSAATFSTRFSRDKFPFSGGEFVLVTKSQSDIQRLSAPERRDLCRRDDPSYV
jgi:hypothetical protein